MKHMEMTRTYHHANGQITKDVDGLIEVPAWRVVWADGSSAEVRGADDLNEVLMDEDYPVASFTYAPLWRQAFVVAENPFVKRA